MRVHFLEKGNGYMAIERIFIPEVFEGAVTSKQVNVE